MRAVTRELAARHGRGLVRRLVADRWGAAGFAAAGDPLVDAVRLLLAVLLLAGCTTWPDEPEIQQGTVALTVFGPARVLLACPAGQPVIVAPSRR
jgi:hypothetical protein